jgi:hypothetical protein
VVDDIELNDDEIPDEDTDPDSPRNDPIPPELLTELEEPIEDADQVASGPGPFTRATPR